MTLYFVKDQHYHTYPESSRCTSRYLGEQLRASLRGDYEKCGHCFHDGSRYDD